MKVLLDTCVIYPTVMRQTLLGVASKGIFTPLWSARIVEEWQRAAQKLGPDGALQAEAECARLKAAWPKASVEFPSALADRLWLPDPADVHVLAAAIAGSADIILTLNAKDFPRHILAEEGLSRADPDAFLIGVFEAHPRAVQEAAAEVLDEARRLSDPDWTIRSLMKKARMPRLGKALERAEP
ncbi:MAG: PIN domain-containing protein [Pseudomonadota bacterium]